MDRITQKWYGGWVIHEDTKPQAADNQYGPCYYGDGGQLHHRKADDKASVCSCGEFYLRSDKTWARRNEQRAEEKKCTCIAEILMTSGCQCGGK